MIFTDGIDAKVGVLPMRVYGALCSKGSPCTMRVRNGKGPVFVVRVSPGGTITPVSFTEITAITSNATLFTAVHKPR